MENKEKLVIQNIHIGNAIKERLKKQNRSVVWFASQLKCSRTNVYKIFKRESIDTQELLLVSQLLNFNFFKLYADEIAKVLKSKK